MLDQQLGGELPAGEVREGIVARLSRNGWQNRCGAVVIDPELEVWLWQDSPHVEQALKFPGGSLRRQLERTGAWPAGSSKPTAPKETIQALIKAQRPLKTKVVYTRIARSISVHGCTDPAFELFKETIRRWFPREGSARPASST